MRANKERKPKTEEERKAFEQKKLDKLDEQLMKFNQKTGGNTDIFKKAKEDKLDAQLAAFQANEQAVSTEDLGITKTRSASKKEVAEGQ